MMKLLVITALLTSPLLADLYTTNYTFPSYPNLVTATNGSTVIKIGTMQNDSKTFKVYGEATIDKGTPVCFVVMFNAAGQSEWNNARGFLVTAYNSSNYTVYAASGPSMTTYPFTMGGRTSLSSVNAGTWGFFKDYTGINPSTVTTSSGTNGDMVTFKFEVAAAYSNTYKGPNDYDSNSIAYNLYNYSCPLSAYDFEVNTQMAGGFTYDSLRVMRPNNALIAGFSMLLIALGFSASL